MNACLEDVIEHIKPHLLSDIVIKTDKKVLKKGKLMIFQVKQHYLRLMIEIAGNLKMYELPYPFDVKTDDGITTFNYKLKTFLKDDDLQLQAKLMDTSNKSKIYDNLVYILPLSRAGL